MVEIDAQRGLQFDPELVEVFTRLNHEQLRAPIDSEGAADRVRRVIEAEAGMEAANAGTDEQAAPTPFAPPVRSLGAL